MHVDSDGADTQPIDHAQRSCAVLCPDAGSQTVRRLAGDRHRLVLPREWVVDSTGPNTSSRAIPIPLQTPVNMVGSTNALRGLQIVGTFPPTMRDWLSTADGRMDEKVRLNHYQRALQKVAA